MKVQAGRERGKKMRERKKEMRGKEERKGVGKDERCKEKEGKGRL